ncbi:MAG: endonuclease [Candidatus Cloacimonadaceae bacterium]|nr:endonuclease [Candidatus Cloacimonadaceae bacterium]
MKKLLLSMFWISLVCLLMGQTYHIQEGFSTTSRPSGWSGDVYFNSTANIGNLSGGNGAGFNATNKYLQVPAVNGAGTLTFWMKGSASSSDISFKVQKSVGGGAFSDIASYPKPHNTSPTQRTITIDDASQNIVIKFVAYDRSGNSIYLDDIQLTTYSGGEPPQIPDPPTAQTATDITASGFSANWSVSSGATGYYFDLSTNSSFSTFVSPYNDYYHSGTSLAVSSLNPDTSYYYRVRATNSAGTSGNSNTISASTSTSGDPYDSYYSSATGLTGIALKNALHNIIDNNTNSNYDDAKLELFQELDNTNGVVRCVYTGKDYSINSSYNGSSDPNTEHTFAQSWFGTSETNIKKADVHHLFVTKMSVNSSRGNLPFDEVASISETYHEANGYYSYRGTNSDGDDVFEPADQHKGNLARALLYFSVRYEMTLSHEGVDMLETLLAWHNADPVDEAEELRNDRVQSYQGNRNPFVDYPEFASYIWGGALPNTIVDFNPASASVSEDIGSISLILKITNPSSTATTAQVALFSGSATDLNNYTTQSVTFPANSSANQQITLYITNDSQMEGTENFELRIINVSGGNQAIAGNYASFNLSILDNDIPAPTALSAENIGFTGFRAKWQAVNGVEGYLLDISPNSQFSSYAGLYHDYYTEDTAIDISGLQSGTTYYYRLRSQYNEGYSAYSNVISVQTSAIIELLSPTGISATAVSHEGFTARWDAVSGAEYYQIQVFEQSGGYMGDPIISEYVEGSSNNKYLEIYNGTGQSVDLSSYQLKLYSNGSATASQTVTLSGNLAHGACKVYRNSGAVLTLPEGVTAEVNTAIQFNGDDAISLNKGASYVDIFGKIGNDPGTAWTADGGYSTLDKTLRRKASVTQGISLNPAGTGASAFTTLGTEWDMFSVDTADGLGSHTHQGASVLEDYDNLQTSIATVRVSGLDPLLEYSFRVRALNAGYTGDYSAPFAVNTLAESAGAGSGTAVNGVATTIIVPALVGMVENYLEIEPSTTGNPDYGVNVSMDELGIYFDVTSSDSQALNGNYTLHHDGLAYTPQGLRYSFGGDIFYPEIFSIGSIISTITVSGISGGKSVLRIEVLKSDDTLPVELSAFNASLFGGNNAHIQWVSQSETNLLGYYIYRNQEQDILSASLQSELIPATNSSTQQSYLFKDILPQPGDYYYWLEYRNLDGSNGIRGPISLQYLPGEPPAGGAPALTSLTRIFPNPGSDTFCFEYDLAKSSHIIFRVFNLKGQKIRQWDIEGKVGHSLRTLWDAKDISGNKVANGGYILQMIVDKEVFSKKIVVMN